MAHRATYGGGIFLSAAADATINASTISHASAEARGGCAYIDESATLALSGSHFNGCTAQEGGGGFFTQPASMLQVTASVFERGFAFAGGVLLSYGSVYAADSTFRDSFALTYCGGILILGSSASFAGQDLILRALVSAGSGAAVVGAAVVEHSVDTLSQTQSIPPMLSMRRVTVENCHAQLGGSVALNGGIIDLEQGFITQSLRLSITDSTAMIVGSVFVNCTVPELGGGCIRVRSSVVTIIDSQFKGCVAPQGGAIITESESRLVLRAVVIVDSVATEGSGGAALLKDSSVLDAASVIFANCSAADDGGAVSVVEDSRVSLGGSSMLGGNVAAGSGGAVSVRASDLYIAPRCSFVVLTSVQLTRALTLDFSNGGGDYIDVARAWLVKSERHSPEAYFDARGVLGRLSPVAGKRTSLELCLEPATYEVWTASYLGEAWPNVNWELATDFGDVHEYNETRFSAVGHPGLVHGLQSASFKIIGDAEEEHKVRITGNVASGNGGAIAILDKARLLTATGPAFDSNLAIGGVGGAVSVGRLCWVDIHGVEAIHNAAVDGGSLGATALSTVRLKSAKLHANVATKRGGGIFAKNVEAMELTGLTLVDNVAYANGGAGFFDTSPVVARDVVCFGNVARGDGGALAAFASYIQLQGISFERNRAIEGSGGALYVIADSAVDITPVPACSRVMLLIDWTQTSASCSPAIKGGYAVTCDTLSDFCPVVRNRLGNDTCDGCACHKLGLEAENYFEIVANDVLGTGRPRAKAITAYDFCLSPSANVSTYRVVAYDDVRRRGWFSGKLHVAIASEHGWSPAVEDFSFDGEVGETHFRIVDTRAKTTRFVENVAGRGGGAIFHDEGLSLTGFEATDNVLGNSAGYGDIWATPTVRIELQPRNVTLATSSAIPIYVRAKLVDAKGQLVATNSRLFVDVHWSADVDGVEAVGTQNSTSNGFVDFAALAFMAPVGATCSMYLELDALRSTTINVSIISCPPGYEEEWRKEVAECYPCRSNFYWHKGRCRLCVDGMSCEDDDTIPLEHRIVGDVGALALSRGYHRQSVYSRRPVRCDGGKLNHACPGGIDSVGCDSRKFVLNKPRCQVRSSVSNSCKSCTNPLIFSTQVCKTMYFRQRFRCLSCSQVRGDASIATKSMLAFVLISALVVLGPWALRRGEFHDASLESEASIRFTRALMKVQTKYKALFVTLQLWSVLLFTASVELPPVTIGFLDFFRVFSAAIPGNCFTKRRFSLYTNLIVWTIGPFALVIFCVFLNIIVNLVISINARLAATKRVDGQQQRPFVNPVYQNACRDVGQSTSGMRRRNRKGSRYIFSRTISDSQVALAVLVIVAFLFWAVSYPPMAYVVLSFFTIDTYDDPHKPNRRTAYSRFDPAIRAEGPTYNMHRTYASLCVATHVLGIPAFFAISLHRVRDRLDPVDSDGVRPRLNPQKPSESRARCAAIAQMRVHNPELRSLRPLWFVYLPQYFNFEVLELLRRMAMMTLPTLVSRVPATQAALTCITAYASTRLYRQVQPFLSTSDCEFFENTQWLTLVLSSILLYITAGQMHEQIAGYTIIIVFVTSAVHATILVARDIRQEKFILQAITEYMSKMRDSFHGHRFDTMSYCPGSGDGRFKRTADNVDGLTHSGKDGGDDDSPKSHQNVPEPRSPSKVANVAN